MEMEIQFGLNPGISWQDEELFTSQEVSPAWSFCSFIHIIDNRLFGLQ
jgi:hypothetical protein